MKQFITFLKKEFAHVLRDRKTLLILFGMPIMQILIFGFALTNEVKNSKIVIVDYAKDIASQKIITKIEASSYFEIEKAMMSAGDRSGISKRDNQNGSGISCGLLRNRCISVMHRSRSSLMHRIPTRPIH